MEPTSFLPKLACKGKPSGRRREGALFLFLFFEDEEAEGKRGQCTGKGQEGLGTEMPAPGQSLSVGKRGWGGREGGWGAQSDPRTAVPSQVQQWT